MNESPSREQDHKQWSDELRAAGWKQVLQSNVWKSPTTGKLHQGPYLAWTVMQAETKKPNYRRRLNR